MLILHCRTLQNLVKKSKLPFGIHISKFQTYLVSLLSKDCYFLLSSSLSSIVPINIDVVYETCSLLSYVHLISRFFNPCGASSGIIMVEKSNCLTGYISFTSES